MIKLSDAVAQLAALKKNLDAPRHASANNRLRTFAEFGSNPGRLQAAVYVPDHIGARPPLVVVLHGCTQTAAGYDAGAGWSRLADEHGFVLLFPEQIRANNPNLCFNWFSPQDSTRDSGEALSIRQMIARLVDERDIDPTRIFITGLSAGGAMTSVMLAAYPELFSGGAILAGLPYGCASNIPQALECMRGQYSGGDPVPLVRRASRHEGPWPTISVWHGTGDATVSPGNAGMIVSQWAAVHGVDATTPSRVETVDGYPRRVWRDAGQRDVIEEYSIAGMGHGTPLDTSGGQGCGKAGPYMLDVGISSTRRIAAFWGLAATSGAKSEPLRPAAPAGVPAVKTIRAVRTPVAPSPPRNTMLDGIGATIDGALRAAGLIRDR